MDKIGVGRCLFEARATHASHRDNLRCLGLSVGIAIALSGCDQVASAKSDYDADRYGEAVSWLLQHKQHSAWADIETAPHNGTIVEIQNSGSQPYFGLYRWVDGRGWAQVSCGPSGPNDIRRSDYQGGLIGDGPWLSWRPYKGRPEDYVSPAKGDQEIYYDHVRHRCWATFWPHPGTKEAKAIEDQLDEELRWTNDAASGIETRSAIDAQRRGPKSESQAPEGGDAQ